MNESCFKCSKPVVAGCGYNYLGNCFHARCLHCDTCGGKLVGKPFLTCENNKIFCDEECTRNYVLICDDVPNKPPAITINCSPDKLNSESPDEPLFIPTLRSSPVPPGSFNRMYRTDSLSSDLSGTSHTSDNSYTHDANKKPKKRILKHPHEKKNGHRSKHVHWRLDEVQDSRCDGDDTSLDSNDTYPKAPNVTAKNYNQGWSNNEELSWNVNLQWNGRSEVMGEDGTPDIDLPFDDGYPVESTPISSSHWQVEKLPDIPSHQLTISPSDDNSTPLLAEHMKQIQLQDTPTQLQATPIELIDTPIELIDTPIELIDTPIELINTPIQPVVDTPNLSPESSTHVQDSTTTLTSTPVTLRKKNGVTNAITIPPVLKIRDSMVCDLEESIYEIKPNMFQFPEASSNSSPRAGKKISADGHQLPPLPEDNTSLPSVLKIEETNQVVESDMKSSPDQLPSSTHSNSNSVPVHLNKDVMGQNIVAASPAVQEQSPTTPSSCGSSSDIKTMAFNPSSLSFTHTSSDGNLNSARDFVGNIPSHLMNLSSSSTSSLPVNFSSYMNQPKLQDNSRMMSTLPHHGSPGHVRRHISTSSLPVVTNGNPSHLDDFDDIDTPISELDVNTRKATQAPVARFTRHHSYGPEHYKVNSPTSSRAKQKLEAIMKDIELEENHRISSIKPRNVNGCGACNQPVAFESTFMLDGIGYHPSCFVCFACGRSLRGKRICKAKNQLYCEEDYLYHGFRLTQRNCDHCNMPIISQDQVEAYTKIFHKQCFQCSECYSLLPSEQDSRLLEGRPVCIKCHLLVMYKQTAPTTIRRTAQPIQGYSEML